MGIRRVARTGIGYRISEECFCICCNWHTTRDKEGLPATPDILRAATMDAILIPDWKCGVCLSLGVEEKTSEPAYKQRYRKNWWETTAYCPTLPQRKEGECPPTTPTSASTCP